MDSLKNRIPSKSELITVFVACMIPVHIWAIFNVLREVPAWILRMSMWEMIGVIAYTQVFALFESLILFILILLAAIILPGNLLRNDISIASALIMFVLSIWLVILHYNSTWLFSRNIPILSIWLLTLVGTILLLLFLSKRLKPMQESIIKIMGRFAVLAAFYLVVDALSIVIVLFRNITL